MFAKSALLVLAALSLAVDAIPATNQQGRKVAQCPAPKTVTKVQTVTVSARTAPTATSRVVTGGNNNNNNNNNNNGGGKNTKTTSTAKGGSKTTAAAVGTTTAKGGSKTTSAAAGSKTTAATGGNGGNNAAGGKGNTGNPQTSTTLDPRVIASGFANNGQDVPTAGQVPSLTSTNNFINFCLTVPNLPITNGKQITTGSCNPAPIGVIPSVDNMPSSKFTFPANFGTVKANTAFTVSMAIQNMQTGFFVNAQQNYFAAPQQLNSAGQIQGHSHIVIEQLSSLTQTTPTDPKKFAYFKGLNAAASGGKLTADITDGLAVGVYKLSSINTSSNHQPAIVPVAQHGSLDDSIYFTVTADGNPANNGAAAGGAAAGSTKAGTGTNTGSTKTATSANTGSTKGAANTNSSGSKGGKTGRRALNRMA